MSVLQSHQCLFSFSTSAFSLPHRLRTTRLISLYRPPESISPSPSLSAFIRTRPDRIRVSAAADVEGVKEEEEDGPIELPPSATSPFSSTNSIFATSDDPTPLQLATSVMLTGAITIFLFRSIRRRAKRSKELVRQITVTVRTIINGICYLATFVFGINAVGLLLYSGQLAFNEDSDADMKATTEPGDSSGNNSEVNKSNEDQSSGD